MSGRKSGLLFVIICILILVVFTQGKGSFLPKVSDKLLSELKSPDEAVRFQALRKLETMRNVSGVAGLKIALQDKSSRIRQRALNVLKRKRTAEAVEVIIDALQHEDPKIRNKAAIYLGDLGNKEAIQPLISAMNDQDIGVRLSSSGALARWRQPEVKDALLNALKNENANIRAYAARALGLSLDPTVVPELLEVVKDNAHQVRAMSIYALGFLADKRSVAALVDALQDRSVEVRLQAVQAIRKYKGLMSGKDSRNYLERALSDKAAQVRGVAYAEFSFLFSKEVTFSFIVKGLSDEDASVRLKVLEVLRRYGPTYSPSILFPALKDHDCRNRGFAARSIGAFKHKEIVPRLRAAFDGQCKMPKDIVRFIEFQGQLKKENFSALKEKLYDSDYARRRQAIRDIKPNEYQEAVPLLIALIKEKNVYLLSTQPDAVYVLGKIRDLRAVPVLSDILKGSIPGPKYAAAYALAQMGGDNVDQTFMDAWRAGNKGDRRTMLQAVTSSRNPDFIKFLALVLEEEGDVNERYKAAVALVAIGSPSAIPILKRAAKKEKRPARKWFYIKLRELEQRFKR